jgi:membrane-bound serine protease (ClpP class)
MMQFFRKSSRSGYLLRLIGIFFFLGGLFSFFSGELLLGQDTPEPSLVYLAKIQGTIDPATSDFLQTAIQKATMNRAEALLVELDTPGGLLSSTRSMSQAMDQSTIPIIVYVTPAGASATSAGALLMLSSHVAAMTPGSNVGAAHPVGAEGRDIEGAMGDKVVQDTAAFARGLAQLHGRNVELAEKVVTESQSFTAAEALEGNLIEVISSSREDLLLGLHGRVVQINDREQTLATQGARIVEVEMTWGQKVLHTIAHPNIAAILMTVGMLLIYVEISNPGLTIAGIMGVITLLLGFMAFQALPIRTGGAILLFLGMLLMILEPFIITGGVLAGGGVVAFLLGLLWVIDPAGTDLQISWTVWIPLAILLSTAATIITVAAYRMRRLSKETWERLGGGAFSGLSGYRGKVVSLGADGKTGKVSFRGEVWDFESEEILSEGDWVKVEAMVGFRAKVHRVDGEGALPAKI